MVDQQTDPVPAFRKLIFQYRRWKINMDSLMVVHEYMECWADESKDDDGSGDDRDKYHHRAFASAVSSAWNTPTSTRSLPLFYFQTVQSYAIMYAIMSPVSPVNCQPPRAAIMAGWLTAVSPHLAQCLAHKSLTSSE